MPPHTQTAIIQSKSSPNDLPVVISHTVPVPELVSPYDVRVRVLAVSLNPTDHKMITNFFINGNTVGCDFCGIIESAGPSSQHLPGARVCGAAFPYRPSNPHNGAFAQWVVGDSRHMLRVPDTWSNTQAAALGTIGWATACMALSDPNALGLEGQPSQPVVKPLPVLVYGGGTATGILAIQLLKQSGYTPIVVCSPASATFAIKLGAAGTASYTSATCVDTIRALAGGVPIRHALDCITDAQSAAICFGALSRTGGRYACLEEFPEAWHTRRAVKVAIVMGFEMQGVDVDLDHPVYKRRANPQLHFLGTKWAYEVQKLLDAGLLTTQPTCEVEGQWMGVINGMVMLQRGEVRGEKLVVRVAA